MENSAESWLRLIFNNCAALGNYVPVAVAVSVIAVLLNLIRLD